MGRKRGPAPKLSIEMQEAVYRAYQNAEVPIKQIESTFGICRATIYKIVARLKPKQQSAPQDEPEGRSIPTGLGPE